MVPDVTSFIRTLSVQVTEIGEKGDPRANSLEMHNAIKGVVSDIVGRYTFKTMLKIDLTDDANALLLISSLR